MQAIIVSYTSERFGHPKKANTKPTTYTMNRKATKIHQLQLELQTLKEQYKTSIEEEKEALADVRNILRKRLMILRRAEVSRCAEGVWIPKEEDSKNINHFGKSC